MNYRQTHTQLHGTIKRIRVGWRSAKATRNSAAGVELVRHSEAWLGELAALAAFPCGETAGKRALVMRGHEVAAALTLHAPALLIAGTFWQRGDAFVRMLEHDFACLSV